MIIERLYEAVEARGPVCVGLDPSPELIPQGLLRTAGSLAEAYLKFNRGIVDATLDVVACYKVQIAHYEALGVEGLACYRDTLRYIRDRGALAIGDVKRGDIGSTAARYARAHFEGDFEADFITLTPYFGTDGIAPFLAYLEMPPVNELKYGCYFGAPVDEAFSWWNLCPFFALPPFFPCKTLVWERGDYRFRAQVTYPMIYGFRPYLWYWTVEWRPPGVEPAAPRVMAVPE